MSCYISKEVKTRSYSPVITFSAPVIKEYQGQKKSKRIPSGLYESEINLIAFHDT